MMIRFLFPALGGLLFGYDIGATSGATISLQVLIFDARILVLYVMLCFDLLVLFSLYDFART